MLLVHGPSQRNDGFYHPLCQMSHPLAAHRPALRPYTLPNHVAVPYSSFSSFHDSGFRHGFQPSWLTFLTFL